ncbi:MAG TPA: serine hydrolase [Mycobacterium sp.]|jgi:CubicO group peptidase (beta-lactamase class C family)
MIRRTAQAVLTVLLMALLACGSSHQAGPSTRPSGLPPNEVSGVDIPDGRVDAAVGKLDGLIDDLMKHSGIPGMAVAVVHDGKVVYTKGFGVKDVRTGTKVDPDTVFQIASLSKPVGATVVAREVTHNVVGWDMPIWVTLPSFQLSDPYVTRHVTIADLYAHRSGVPDHAGDSLEDLGYDRTQVLQRLKYLPLDAFRSSYAYTNFGITAAAEAVAAAANKPWDVLSDEVLYRPLGMTSSSSRFADYQSRPDRAVGHVKTPDHGYQPLYTRNADAQSPAGGVSSSVNDMARWLMMVLGKGTYNGVRIAAQEALVPTVTPQVISVPAGNPNARASFYGYGFNVSVTSAGRTEYSHSGAFALGAASAFAALPSANVGIIALTNAAPVGVPETLAAEFMDLVQYGEIHEDWAALYRQAFDAMDRPEGTLVGRQPPVAPAPARPLDEYVGEYANPYWGPAKISQVNGVLQLTLGPRGDTFPLSHWDGDTFTFTLQNENAPPGTISKATFAGNNLTLEYYDHNKLGTFTR